MQSGDGGLRVLYGDPRTVTQSCRGVSTSSIMTLLPSLENTNKWISSGAGAHDAERRVGRPHPVRDSSPVSHR